VSQDIGLVINCSVIAGSGREVLCIDHGMPPLYSRQKQNGKLYQRQSQIANQISVTYEECMEAATVHNDTYTDICTQFYAIMQRPYDLYTNMTAKMPPSSPKKKQTEL